MYGIASLFFFVIFKAFITPALATQYLAGAVLLGAAPCTAMSGVNLVLIVAEPSLSGRSDLERILKTAEIFRTKAAICVNKYDTSLENTEKIERFCADLGVPFVGRVPYDRQASAAINEGKSLADVDCPASRALRQVFECTMLSCGATAMFSRMALLPSVLMSLPFTLIVPVSAS